MVAYIRQLVCIPLISLLAVGMLAACDDQQRPETVENLTTTPASSVATSSSESTATPTPQPTATSPVGFGPGTYQVGKDIQPGMYAGRSGTGTLDSCYWERLSGATGDFSDLIANSNASGQFYVEILDTDKYFKTDCVLEIDLDASLGTTIGSDTWRWLVVSPEERCSTYDPDDYPYPQSVEQQIVDSMGGIIYGPYTGMWFGSTSETDIEHIVARSETHDSGLCATDTATRRQFASDLINLTLASPAVNRSQKSGKDAAEWVPDLNRCWFASRVVEVRNKYDLTIDESERDALESILSGCTSTEMIVQEAPAQTATPVPTPEEEESSSALEMYDDNGNGRISCAEARNHGIAPVRRGHPIRVHERR